MYPCQAPIRKKTTASFPSLADLLPRRTRPRSRARQPSLSREQIVRVAVELADAEGPDAISMRRIAARLGVGAMTLYGYVADRDALLAHMINEVVAETGPWGVSSGSWRADLECHARQFRDLCLRHSWLPVELGTAPFLIAPRLVAAAEFVLAALEPQGIDPDTAGAVPRTLQQLRRRHRAAGGHRIAGRWRARHGRVPGGGSLLSPADRRERPLPAHEQAGRSGAGGSAERRRELRPGPELPAQRGRCPDRRSRCGHSPAVGEQRIN